MEIIGLIAISIVLMMFKGGIAGVIMLWGWVIWKAVDTERRKERARRANEEFKRTHGYDAPWYIK